ncbi:MAG: ABC transporter permease [Lachnospiraceae bacterium]
MSRGLDLKKQWKKRNVSGIMLGTIALFIFFSIIEAKFLTPYNIILIMRNSCILLIAGIGMTMAILISQIDLSVGSVLSLSGVVTAVCLQNGIPVIAAMMAGLLTGVLFGLVNGFLIAVFRFDYWIVTFATMSVGSGMALVIADGATVKIQNSLMDWLGNGKIFGIYFLVIFTVLLIAVMMYILKRTKLGYQIYSIGGSEQVSKTCGIAVTKCRIIVYVLSGIFAAIAGILISGMTNSASPIVGAEYSFNTMAAVIIGGTSFDGGKGGLAGTVLGTLLLRILSSGLNMIGIPAIWQKVIIGIVIVVILVTEALGEKKKKIDGLRRVYSNEA